MATSEPIQSDPFVVPTTTYGGGSVVQLLHGDPSADDALVASLHPATIVLTDARVSAVEGDLEWSWLIDDLEAVHHSPHEGWSILVVPGVPDHGVAVGAHDTAEFRRLLDHARGVGSAATGPSSDSPAVPVPQDDGRPATIALDGPAHVPPHHPSPPRESDPDLDLDLGPGFDLDADPGPLPTTPVVSVLDPTGHDPLATVISPGLEKRTRRRWARRGPSPAASGVPLMPPALAGLEARSISAWFGSHNVLDRVSLTMHPGEVTALIGPSGCGKSTFLRILNRMHELIPSASLAGEVLLDGVDVYDPSRKLTDARRQIGMVFQKPNPFPAMSIYDNVVASLQLTGTNASTGEKDELVERCLGKAGLWTEVRDRLRQPGGGLSGGQQQRLCIARALAIKPRVLLMDEPCSALDPTSTRRIEQTIEELASEVTIVIVTHNMQQAQRVSHRCAFFLAEQGTPGVIVEHGPTGAMFSNPQDTRTNDYVHGRFG